MAFVFEQVRLEQEWEEEGRDGVWSIGGVSLFEVVLGEF